MAKRKRTWNKEKYQRYLSEECHNSYFFSNLDNLGETENGEERLALTEEQTQYLKIIIERFMDVYRQ